MKGNLIIASLIVALCPAVFADNITMTGTVEHAMPLNQSLLQHQGLATESSDVKTIDLLQFELSASAQQTLYRRVEQLLQARTSTEQSISSTTSRPSVQLGMNHVPVFDQGKHGTCVTFAVTSAIDAAMNKGDDVSQLCLLQLGSYLEQQGQGLSGWDGFWEHAALERIDQYGYIKVAHQKKYGCGGVKKYPSSKKPTTSMTPEEYSQYSETLSNAQVTWKTLFDTQNFTSDKSEMEKKLSAVKTALKAGQRVSFSVLLPRTDLGTVGADAWHHWFADTWVLSYEIAKALETATTLPGHAMVITGYDDHAVAMDRWGHRHHGLLTLRNSWGSNVADWGDFYMSYDYFKALAIEANAIK
ncbi:MAG: C1 family peptidase [Legionellaceae bacterium]